MIVRLLLSESKRHLPPDRHLNMAPVGAAVTEPRSGEGKGAEGDLDGSGDPAPNSNRSGGESQPM